MSVITFLSADLAERIDFCWYLPARRGLHARFHEFLPDSGVHLVARLSPAGARMVLLGPATEKASIAIDRSSEYLGVRFRTGQAPRLADVRASELTNRYVELTRIGGRTVDSVTDQLQASPELTSRQRVLEELLRTAAPPLVTDPWCRRAATLLEAGGGQFRVDELARELGLHVRSLERRLLVGLGVTPKRLIRLVRLRHVLGALRAGEFDTLADVAHACGYSDQPHMIRDFKKLTARVPGERGAFRARPLEIAQGRILHRHDP